MACSPSSGKRCQETRINLPSTVEIGMTKAPTGLEHQRQAGSTVLRWVMGLKVVRQHPSVSQSFSNLDAPIPSATLKRGHNKPCLLVTNCRSDVSGRVAWSFTPTQSRLPHEIITLRSRLQGRRIIFLMPPPPPKSRGERWCGRRRRRR